MRLAKSECLEGNLDILSAEALAVLLGLRSAALFSFLNLWVEFDSQILVKAIIKGGYELSPQSSLISKIKGLISTLGVRGFTHVHRSQNKLAHNLASFAIKEGVSSVWESVPPVWLKRLLDMGLLGCNPLVPLAS